ncbi:hypothetical protein Taro_013666 [Colocasia esculenta]|uniref:Uncharacterized protein n=1 Tax=Colocasia esculenta TaxID=4460 RepID=A0A843UGT7_COLES|nr:hypothetical protein [Colocasia esculenta]
MRLDQQVLVQPAVIAPQVVEEAVPVPVAPPPPPPGVEVPPIVPIPRVASVRPASTEEPTVIVEMFMRLQPPTYLGGLNPNTAKHWVHKIERVFVTMRTVEEEAAQRAAILKRTMQARQSEESGSFRLPQYSLGVSKGKAPSGASSSSRCHLFPHYTTHTSHPPTTPSHTHLSLTWTHTNTTTSHAATLPTLHIHISSSTPSLPLTPHIYTQTPPPYPLPCCSLPPSYQPSLLSLPPPYPLCTTLSGCRCRSGVVASILLGGVTEEERRAAT